MEDGSYEESYNMEEAKDVDEEIVYEIALDEKEITEEEACEEGEELSEEVVSEEEACEEGEELSEEEVAEGDEKIDEKIAAPVCILMSFRPPLFSEGPPDVYGV